MSKSLDPLSHLAIKFGSDKYGGHQYTPSYHKIFRKIRYNKLRILEIGVGGYSSEMAGGSSLMMWAEYFPNSLVFGLDISKKNLNISPRIRVIEGSQADVVILADLVEKFGPFDIIIDDGSHVVDHVLVSFRELYHKMSSGGIYIVEDTQTCFGQNSNAAFNIFDLAHLVGLQMHREEGYSIDDCEIAVKMAGLETHSVATFRNFICFTRGENNYPSNLNLDLTHPVIKRVSEQIRRVSLENNFDRSVISQIDMLIWGRRWDEAERLARVAKDKFSDNLSLLYELLRLMEWISKKETAEEISGLIMVILGNRNKHL